MQMKWFDRVVPRQRAVPAAKKLQPEQPEGPRRLTISLLTFGTFEHCVQLLPDVCELIVNHSTGAMRIVSAMF